MSKSAPWKLSPSKFHFGFDNCQRCYCLDIKEGITQPGSFPGVFSKFDSIHKNFFTGQHTSEVLKDIPAGTFIKGPGDKFLESELIEFDDPNMNCFISGKGDAFLELDDGSYAIIDFKTSTIKDSVIWSYSTQLHAYKYALENNKPNKPGLAPITRMGLLVFEPASMTKSSNDTYNILHNAKWFEVPIDDQKFLKYVEKVVSVLAQPGLPDSSSNCNFCKYRNLNIS